MRKKKKRLILIFVVIGIILAILIGFLIIKNINIEAEGFIKIRMYDFNGNLIGSSSTLSVVNGVSGVTFIDVTTTVVNDGSVPLTCNITSAEISSIPIDFEVGEKIAQTGQRISWITPNLIPTYQFEGGQNPDTIKVTVKCFYNIGTQINYLPDKTGQLNISILSDQTGSFTIIIEPGGIGTEFCGDNICQSNENQVSCPADCSPPSQNVKFRTTDLSYVSGSAIGYSSVCGNNLTAYGYETSGNTFADCNTLFTNPPIMTGIVGDLGGSGSNNIKLYADNSDPNEVWLCQDLGGLSSGKRVRFDKTDSDASKVSINSIATGSKELNC